MKWIDGIAKTYDNLSETAQSIVMFIAIVKAIAIAIFMVIFFLWWMGSMLII